MILALWTAEEDATIIRLRAQKLSAAHIASFLPGRSRNAVIGRVGRLLGKGIEVAPAIKPVAKPKVVKAKPARITLAVASVPFVPTKADLARIEFRKRLKHGALGGAGRNTTKSPVTIPSTEFAAEPLTMNSGQMNRLPVTGPVGREECVFTPLEATSSDTPSGAETGRAVRTGSRHFLDVRTFDCRYPTWDHTTPPAERFYCARPIDRGSYCTEHASLCYVPAKPPREAPYRERRYA